MSILRLVFILIFLLLIIAFSIPIQIFCNIIGFKLKRIYPLYFYQMIKIVTGININFNTTRLNKKNMGVLYIANHVSWFDIICLGTLLNARFIAKKEVSQMGIFGFLAMLSNTFFIDNENKNKIIKNFKSSMLECAFDNNNEIKIQPISICYSKLNNIPMGIYLRRNIAWVGDTSMVAAMANFLRSGRITVDIIFHDLMSVNNFKNRKELAAHCEKQILSGLNQSIKVN